MAFHQRRTSLISILSCEHGRLRREQRDIDKRDIQKALKYGKRQACWGHRWMVTYDGLVFITDHNMIREVTAYPAPLALAPESFDDHTAHNKAKLLLEKKPELCVSHTVLVVDNSGSMLIHDIRLHRDRQTAAYTTTALEFIAEQIFNQTANNSDLVSLVEFSETAHVVFSREPVSWVLYNKLLSRRDSRDFRNRQSARVMETLRCDSNYLPALDLAKRLLEVGLHDNCALSLLFLSDGAPSDARALKLTPMAAQRRMNESVQKIASIFGENLSVTMVGFGNSLSDFSSLSSMVAAIKESSSDSKAEFIYCDKFAHAIGDAVTSLVTSLTKTRTALIEGQAFRNLTNRRIAAEDSMQISTEWKYYRIVGHFRFNPRAPKGFIPDYGLPPGVCRQDNLSEIQRRQRSPPPFLAISSRSCGEGVERVAFRSFLCDDNTVDKFVFGEMVAKETNSVELIQDNIDFHRGFLETQDLASLLASEFNRRLCALPDFDSRTTPRVSFLQCSVLTVEDSAWPGEIRGMLVEKKLDTDRFGWCKWNNNAGAVEGKVVHVPLDVDYELAKLQSGDLGAIVEDDDEDSVDDSVSLDCSYNRHGEVTEYSNFDVESSEYLQAFTHFSYLYTNRKVMVCDLQGVLNTDMIPPTFELTDPAVHYASKRRQMVFGRTDKGRKGMQLFFNSHKCSRICQLMQLSKKNKQWRSHWHDQHS